MKRHLFAIICVVFFLAAVCSAAEKNYCKTLDPLVRAALKVLPTELEVPCDADHLVEVPDMDSFLKKYFESHPGQANSPFRVRFERDLRDSFAFALDVKYPIYINIGRYQKESKGIKDGYAWLAYAFAPQLTHERTHAEGESRESVAHAAEKALAKKFLDQGKIPPGGYDTIRLEAIIQAEKKAEESALVATK